MIIRNNRTIRGAVNIELVSVLGFLVVVAILGIDVGFSLIGAWMNDAAAREAARAAAIQTTSDDAKSAAVTAVQSYVSGSVFLTSTKALTDAAHFKYETFPDSNGNPDISKGPYVEVTTATTVRLPVPLKACGFGEDVIDYKQSYTFPILKFNPAPVPPPP